MKPGAWRDDVLPGGGILFDLGSHLIDQALCLFGLPESIKATLRRWIMNKAVDTVFIDYLTLIKISYNKGRNDLDVGALTQELREFAKETGLPIVLENPLLLSS